MENRIITFITALRHAGIRVSVAESADALRAIEQVGIADKALFQAALQTALIKEAPDVDTFRQLFPLYFRRDEPPPMQSPGGGSLSDDEQQMLQQMLQHMLDTMTPEQLAQLFHAMMSGQSLSRQQLHELLEQGMVMPVPSSAMSPHMHEWVKYLSLSQMQFDRLEDALQELLEQLQQAGMREEALRQLEQDARDNKNALQQQLEQQMDRQLLEEGQAAGQGNAYGDMLDRPFEHMSPQEMHELRNTVSRLAARLRSRAALRQRRSNAGKLDTRHTIRTNLRFGGVPMVVRHRRRHLKPKITILCDLSYSMRPVARFTLLLIYALQDQVSRTRSFAYIDDLTDISTDFAEMRPEQALEVIQDRVRPPGSYATDLGNSLHTFVRDHLDSVDYRTTFIVLGDGRNNYRDPNLKAFDQVCRRARSVIWFNPESPHMWGQEYPDTLNSDMLDYAHMCDAVHHVSNLRQLIAAIDSLFSR